MTNTTDQPKVSGVKRRQKDYRDAMFDLGSIDPDADGLTILQQIVSCSKENEDIEESLLEHEVAEVERLFSEGKISVKVEW